MQAFRGDRLTNSLLAAWCVLVPSQMIHAETLEQYAAKCDKLTESTVPGFDCDKGTEVPDGIIKARFAIDLSN